MAGGIPAACTACGTAIPAGATRCIQCGRVYGEENRCPTCQAYAAVRRVGDSYVCAACGAPRLAGPGSFLEKGSSISLVPAVSTQARAKSVAFSGGAIGLKLVGVVPAFAGSAIGGFIALIGGTATGAIPGALVATFALGVGGLMWSWGSNVGKTASRMSSSADELAILALAEKHGGSLSATDVARAMGIGVADAEARLTSLADGTRVVMEVTPEGLLRFEFREVRASRASVSARVAAPDAEEAVVEAGGASAQSKSEKR